MKRFTYAMVMAVALVVMISSFAVAGGEQCKAAAKQAGLEECCIKAAKAGEGCHGKDAEAVKAAYASYKEGCDAKAAKAAKASKTSCDASAKAACAASAKAACDASASATDMGKCCIEAAQAGKGCHGMDAEAVKANYEQKVAYDQAVAEVKGDMHKCCAASMEEGKGCCGKDAEGLKADYNQKVEAKTKKVAATEKESADS